MDLRNKGRQRTAARVRLVALCCASVVVLSSENSFATSLGPNLIRNWSFENPDVQGYRVFTNSNQLPGWDLPDNYGELQSNGLYGFWSMAVHGNQWAEIDDPDPGIDLKQKVDTEKGDWYRLTFNWAPRPDILDRHSMEVTINGERKALVGGAGNGSDKIYWNRKSIDFRAKGLSTILGFDAFVRPGDLNLAGAGILLDAVELRFLREGGGGKGGKGGAAVPEPASIALLGLALAGARQRRKRSA